MPPTPRPFNVPPHSTRRPPSSPELSDEAELLGKLLASQAALQAAWNARAQEHETFARDVTQLRKEVEELTKTARATHVLMRRFGKFVPVAIAGLEVLIELGKAALQSMGHHP